VSCKDNESKIIHADIIGFILGIFAQNVFHLSFYVVARQAHVAALEMHI